MTEPFLPDADIFSHTSVQLTSSTVRVKGFIVHETGLPLWQLEPMKRNARQHPRNMRDFIICACSFYECFTENRK
jgi:hypothetical protein